MRPSIGLSIFDSIFLPCLRIQQFVRECPIARVNEEEDQVKKDHRSWPATG